MRGTIRGIGLALTVAWWGAATAAALELPPGFAERTMAEGLDSPVAVAFAPDGRMFVAEKPGRVRVVTASGELESLPLVDISDHVNDHHQRGLLGLAVDRDFADNGFLYLLYTYEDDPSAREGPKVSRLTRVTVAPDGSLEHPGDPETVLVGTVDAPPCPPPSNDSDCLPADARTHAAGTVRSDPSDGTLWVGQGEGASAAFVDPLALRALDERSYAGKILRVDRNGRGLSDHPFCPDDDDLDHVCTKVWAKGLRNPFRFTVESDGRVLAGDVGWESREEIDLIEPGGNYGWPCYEASLRTVGYSDLTECEPEYVLEGSPGAARAPLYEYGHATGRTIVMGPAYTGTSYPPEYRGDFFFGDWQSGLVQRLRLTAGGDVAAVRPFATGWVGGVDLAPGPDGDLVYVDPGGFRPGAGSVRRIVYSSDDGPSEPSEPSAPSDPEPDVQEARDGALPHVSLRRPPRGLRPRVLAGRAADPSGVAEVAVALRPPASGRASCRWWRLHPPRLSRRRTPCDRPVWIPAQLSPGTTRGPWHVQLGRRLPPGRYLVALRAVDHAGNAGRVMVGGGRYALITSGR